MMAEGHRRQAARSVIDHTEHGGRLVAGGDTVNDIGMKKTVALRETKSANPHDGDSRCPLAAAVVSIACPGIPRPAMPDVEAVHRPGFCRYYRSRIPLYSLFDRVIQTSGDSASGHHAQKLKR